MTTALARIAAPVQRWINARLRTRLAVRYGLLFAVAMLAVAGTAQLMIRSHARASVRAAMTTSGVVFDRLWTLKARSLGDSAEVLAHDFGFRAAVASGDAATIESALPSLSRRAHVPLAFVVEGDGKVVGRGPPELRADAASLAAVVSDGGADVVIAGKSEAWRFVVSPILAPVPIGSVVFALPLDDREMRTLEQLSAIPLTARMLTRSGNGWRDAKTGRSVPDSLEQREPVSIDTGDGSALALVKPLPGPDGRPQAALMLSYPLRTALASYWALQLGIALAGMLGLLLVLHGSVRLAAQITAPISALDHAAHALEQGSHAEVDVVGDDEIGRLAASFNRMSAGIIEREHRITHLAFHDTLTGLPNRILFREQLDAAIARDARGGGRTAVLCLDLDGFKSVNDTLGHPVGDALLRVVGDALLAEAGDSVVARLGGDEFAIIMPTGEAARAQQLAQAIVDRLKVPLAADGHQTLTGASIGIAIGPIDGSDADALLKHADLALYRAKQDGRGTFRFFEAALDTAARARRQLELDLREALTAGQFRLHFQPIVDLKYDRVGCFEALLRWEHPERGMVPPSEFVPVAEETGLIVGIGEWAMHEACREACAWPAHVRVAVNVSPLQFRHPGFAAIVVQALARSGLAPERLEVELTETMFLDGAAPTVALLHRLRELGVRVALDDFGTGYSSLSYLRSFPFDKLKIDKSFVDAVDNDRGAIAIIRAIIALADALGMETTAEGVETTTQLALLRGQGCRSIQGYVFSRPVESGQTTPLIERLSLAA